MSAYRDLANNAFGVEEIGSDRQLDVRGCMLPQTPYPFAVYQDGCRRGSRPPERHKRDYMKHKIVFPGMPDLKKIASALRVCYNL